MSRVAEVERKTRETDIVVMVDLDGTGRAKVEVASFVKRCPHMVIASGGIKSLEDVRLLESLGVQEAVAGIALYTGRLNPAEVWRKER